MTPTFCPSLVVVLHQNRKPQVSQKKLEPGARPKASRHESLGTGGRGPTFSAGFSGGGPKFMARKKAGAVMTCFAVWQTDDDRP